jgi:hypothetical protein
MGILKGLYDGPDLQLTYLSTEYLIGFEPVFGKKTRFSWSKPQVTAKQKVNALKFDFFSLMPLSICFQNGVIRWDMKCGGEWLGPVV